jgi:hypothetical protein
MLLKADLGERPEVVARSRRSATAVGLRADRHAVPTKGPVGPRISFLGLNVSGSKVDCMHHSRINGLLIDCKTDDIDAAAQF